GIDPETIDAARIESCKVNWPAPALWIEDAISGTRFDDTYIVNQGVDWVAAGLRAGKALMPFRVTGRTDQMPDPAMTQKWENLFHYSHIV
ncbi:MAG: hypothetical protein KGQ41_04595, partial [Alphaproteobacteria bacterium]|nr:hypothetical protein [Alphaproteobacteria bacterium]